MLWSFDEGWVHLPVPNSARKFASGTLTNRTVSGSTSTVSGLKCNFKMTTSTSYRRLALLLCTMSLKHLGGLRRLLLSRALFHVLPSHVIFGAFRPRSEWENRGLQSSCDDEILQFGSRFAWRPPSVFVTEEWQDPMARTMGLTQPTIRL